MIKTSYRFSKSRPPVTVYSFQFCRDWLNCDRCSTVPNVRYVVVGSGNLNADILFVGEGPGPEEDASGIPFCGKSGSLFNEFLYAVGLDRDTVFVDNVAACRGTSEDGKKTRTPIRSEIDNCSTRLHQTILTLDPLLIVALGNTALQALTMERLLITKVRGDIMKAYVPGVSMLVEYPLLATFHPSYLMRNPNDGFPNGAVDLDEEIGNRIIEKSLKKKSLDDYAFAVRLVKLANKIYKREFNDSKK